jgi:hypothetical protein
MTQKELHNQRLQQEAEAAIARMHTRRHFLKESAMGFGALALGSFLQSCGLGSSSKTASNAFPFDPAHPLAPKLPQFPGRAKSVIYLHMAGAPSQLDYLTTSLNCKSLTGRIARIAAGRQEVRFIRGVPKMLGPQAQFAQHGQSGAG